MALQLDYEFLFIGRDETSFLENYTSNFTQEFGDKSGQIFANIEIKNNPQDAEEIGVRIFDVMQNVYFEDVDEDPYKRFENTLKAVNEVLNDFKSRKESKYIGNLNIIIAAHLGDTLYLSQCGEAEAYMMRNRFVSIISDGLNDDKDDSEDIFTNIAAGTVEPGDFVLFSSTRLLRYIAKGDLAATVRRGGVAETLMEIRDVISTEMLGRIGLTGVGFTDSQVANVSMDIVDVEMSETDMNQEVSMNDADMEMPIYSEEKRTSDKFRKASKKLDLKAYYAKFADIFMSKDTVRQKVLTGLVAIIILLVVGIVFINSTNEKKAKLETLDKVLISVQNKITEAETKRTYDKDGAVVILDKAYMDALEVLNSGYYRDKANLLLIQIDETRDKLDNVSRVTEPSVLADLAEFDSGINPLGFVTLDDQVFIYTANSVYELVLDQLQSELPIDSDEQIIAATGFESRGSLVFLTQSGKLVEYREGTVSYMDTVDETFRKSVSLDDWSNKVYLLDAEEGQIWKYSYQGNKEQFSAAESYLATADEDLMGARDLAIDSSIFVLGADSIDRFNYGENMDLSIANAPFNEFKDATDIYTNENTNFVFALDAQESKIFVYEKDNSTGRLDYKSQYLFDGDQEIRDIYFDIDAGKLRVLTNTKVLELAL